MVDTRTSAATAVFAAITAGFVAQRFTPNSSMIESISSQNIGIQIDQILVQLQYSVLRTIIQQNSAQGTYSTFRDHQQYTENSEARLAAAIETAVTLLTQLNELVQPLTAAYFTGLAYQLTNAQNVIANSLQVLQSLA